MPAKLAVISQRDINTVEDLPLLAESGLHQDVARKSAKAVRRQSS